jgi:hypothetical protein
MEAAASTAASGPGFDTTTVGIAIVVIVIVITWVFMKKETSDDRESTPTIDLHPKQLKYMEEKDAIIGVGKGKAVRCIIDYMREADDLGQENKVQEVLNETAKYADGFEPAKFYLHQRQLDWLASKGVKIGSEEGDEKYKELSNACRTMLDFAIRMDAEGKQDKVKDLFENYRCLNC